MTTKVPCPIPPHSILLLSGNHFKLLNLFLLTFISIYLNMVLCFDVYTLYIICRLYLGRSDFPPLFPQHFPHPMWTYSNTVISLLCTDHHLLCQIVYSDYSCFFFFFCNHSLLPQTEHSSFSFVHLSISLWCD